MAVTALTWAKWLCCIHRFLLGTPFTFTPSQQLVFQGSSIQAVHDWMNNAVRGNFFAFQLRLTSNSVLFLKATVRFSFLFFFSFAKFHVFIYLFIYLFINLLFFCLCGILDSPEHLLTVILAPGSADIDCQRDVSFLLFISSFLRDAAECKSAFSPWRGGGVERWGWVGVGEDSGGEEGRRGGGADRRDGGKGLQGRKGGGDKTCVVWWTVSFSLFLPCV